MREMTERERERDERDERDARISDRLRARQVEKNSKLLILVVEVYGCGHWLEGGGRRTDLNIRRGLEYDLDIGKGHSEWLPLPSNRVDSKHLSSHTV